METELSYFGARDYDPAIRRFMEVDPAGFNENNLLSVPMGSHQGIAIVTACAIVDRLAAEGKPCYHPPCALSTAPRLVMKQALLFS